MASIYRGVVCPDCQGEGKIASCPECSGNGMIVCDLCGGDGVRLVPSSEGMAQAACICKSGYFTCGVCSGGTGVCGRCAGTGFVDGK